MAFICIFIEFVSPRKRLSILFVPPLVIYNSEGTKKTYYDDKFLKFNEIKFKQLLILFKKIKFKQSRKPII